MASSNTKLQYEYMLKLQQKELHRLEKEIRSLESKTSLSDSRLNLKKKERDDIIDTIDSLQAEIEKMQ